MDETKKQVAYKITGGGEVIWTGNKAAAEHYVASLKHGRIIEIEVETLPGISPEMMANIRETIEDFHKGSITGYYTAEKAVGAVRAYSSLVAGLERKIAQLESATGDRA